MIDKLPVELQLLISNELSQTDCFHLMLCNKNLYSIFQIKLYKSIVIESKLNYFHDELVNTDDIRKVAYGVDGVLKYHEIKTSIIRTSFGLKSFFKSLINNTKLIQFIEFLEISDFLPEHFIEFEMSFFLKKHLFPNLTNLKILKIYHNSCFINLNDLVVLLPNEKNLISIDGDFNKLIGKLKKTPIVEHNLISLLNDNNQLQQLSINNFIKSSYLKSFQIMKYKSLVSNLRILEISRFKPSTIPLNYSVINSIGIDLNYLQDSFNKYFYNPMTNSQNNSIDLFRNTTTTSNNIMNNDDNDEFEKKVISKIFSKKQPVTKLELIKLKFDGILIDSNDSYLLIKNINLEKLISLELIDVSEMKNSELIMDDFEVPNGMSPEEAERLALERYNTTPTIPTINEQFLKTVTPHLKNLKELSLDLYNDLYDYGPAMISKLPKLEKIYILIRWNNTREIYCRLKYDEICELYFKGFNHQNLKNLIIDTKNEVSCVNSNNNYEIKGFNIGIIKDNLSKLTNLKTLRLPINQLEFYEFILTLQNFSNLEYLEVIIPEFNTSNIKNDYLPLMICDNKEEMNILKEMETDLLDLLFNEFNNHNKETVMNEISQIVNINLHPTKINLIKIKQIAIILKKLIGINEVENSLFFNYSNKSLKYIKIFNIIVDVKDINKVKIKDKGLDDWFNEKLRN